MRTPTVHRRLIFLANGDGMNPQPLTEHPLQFGDVPSWASAWGEDEFGVWVEFEVEEVHHRLRWIPPGEFWMGSPEDEAGRYDQEGPQHHVEIEEGFWLGEVPCTQDLWTAVRGNNPSMFQSPDRPVEQVSWDDVQEFLSALNERVGDLDTRLPNEAEWEYACRAGTTTSTYVGELEIHGKDNGSLLDGIAWYEGNSGIDFELGSGVYTMTYDDWSEKNEFRYGGSHPVRGKRPNPWGLFDMLGNVFEWCEDPWRSSYKATAESGGSKRVIRGGSWNAFARRVRAAVRLWRVPGFRGEGLGFRLARGQGSPGRSPGITQ